MSQQIPLWLVWPVVVGSLLCPLAVADSPADPGSCCPALAGRGMSAGLAVAPSANPAKHADAPAAAENRNRQAAASGMVWVPPGEFTMGSDAPDTWANEHPAHRVRIDGFWMDPTEVTNAQFAAFVADTGYVTVAERPIDWNLLKQQLPIGTPKPPDEALQPGALVFTPPDRPVPLDNVGAWWSWTPGANWRQPEGPGSSIKGRDNYPVVQVAWEDAAAYAAWAGKQLPTEAQWEYAARGGSDGTRFAWGDTFRPAGRVMANTWDGSFPHRNTQDDGYVTAAPVKQFPANGFGLYDTAGNVWEWTADYYRDDRHVALAKQEVVVNPAGPDVPSDRANPGVRSRVVKGGSFLCHVDYCESYRPPARRGLDPDTGLQHTGFRCIIVPAAEEQQP
jgi:formylglycine-generating enzyme required for sulfatase activity